jgi:hypothetical protein
MRGRVRTFTRCVSSLAIALASFGLVAAAPIAAHATWSDVNCNGGSNDISSWKRAQASDYAAPMAREGYEWGGGCYKLNDHDDTPGAPNSGGEGNDCSGFVFRVWALEPDSHAAQYRYWDYDHFIHGPYFTSDYYDPQPGDPFETIPKGYQSTSEMDAFVYRSYSLDEGHIGLIYKEQTSGNDLIIEAKSDADGTGIWQRQYRSEDIYRAIERKQWTPPCYPKCPSIEQHP